MLLLGAAVFLNYVDRGAIGIAAPLMRSELHLNAKAFGFAVSAFFWFYGPIQLIVGWLVDRFSVYRMMALGLLVWAASTFLTGFAGGFLQLLLLRIMLGIGESIAFPGTSKIIAEQVPAERRGIANAVVSTGIALGPAAGTLAGGLILAKYGWRPIFIVFGVVTLVWLLPWQTLTGRSGTTRASGARSVRVGALVSRWPLWSMSIAHVASNYVFYFLLAWLPDFLVTTRGLSKIDMTLLATLGYAAQAVAAVGFGFWSDRWTRSGRDEARIRRCMMVVAQLVQAAAIAGVLFAGSKTALGVWLVIAGICTGALSLNIYAVAQMFAGPRASGTWVGVQNSIGNLSGIVGPIVTGIVVQRAGYNSAFMLTAAIAALGAAWWAWGVPKIEQIELE